MIRPGKQWCGGKTHFGAQKRLCGIPFGQQVPTPRIPSSCSLQVTRLHPHRTKRMPEKPLAAILTPERGLIFRIVHRECIPWILDNGLHCRSSSLRDPNYRTIGLPELIDRRKGRPVPLPPGGTLSDYVAFYFTPRSVMLMNILTGRGVPSLPAEDIVVVVSSLPRLVNLAIPFSFTNQHAYPPRAEFSSDLSRLPELVDWSILQRSDLSHDPEDPGKKERYQAEALVWNQLPDPWHPGYMLFV